MDRVIRHEPACFISMQGKMEYRPKKLIFNDWTCCNWDPQKKKQVSACLKDLIAKGFEVYFCRENELQLLTEQNLERLDLPPLVSPNTMKDMALKKNKQWSLDTLFLLDDYWLNRLLTPRSTSKKRQIKLSDFISLSKEKRKELLAFINQSEPKVEEILVDEYSESAALSLALLKKNLPQCPLIPAISAMKIDADLPLSNYAILSTFLEKTKAGHIKKVELNNLSQLALRELVTTLFAYPEIEELELINCNNLSEGLLQSPVLNHLKRLNVNSDMSSENLLLLIQSAPNLQELHLGQCSKLDEHFFKSLSLLKLPKLKQLTAYHDEFRAINLTTFLNNNPNLEHLNINSLHEISGCFENIAATTYFPQFKELYASSSSLTRADIQVLLERAPKLSLLNINNMYLSGAFSALASHIIFAELKEVEAKASSLSAADIKNLFEKAPILETLALEYCNEASVGFSQLSPTTRTHHLKKVLLSDSGIDGNNLNVLFKIAPNLEWLELTNCQALAGCSDVLSASLPQLKHLFASNSNLTAKDTQFFLTEAKHLQTLNIEGSQELSDEHSWLPLDIDLKHLKTVNLTNSNLGKNHLIQLLQKAVNLEKLFLNQCTDLNHQDFVLSASSSLPRLKTFSANWSDVANVLVHALLLKAPNIEELHISRCAEITNVFSKLPDNFKLASLKIVDIANAKDSQDELIILLKKAVNLEYLIFPWRLNKQELIDALDFDLKLPKLKKIENFNFSEMSPSHLAKLRVIAPNLEYWAVYPNPTPVLPETQVRLAPKREGNSSKTVDSDTKFNPNKSFQLNRIFYSADNKHPDISLYRLETFDSVHTNPEVCTPSQAFELNHQQSNLQLISCKARRVKRDEFQRKRGAAPNLAKHDLIYGKQRFLLDEQWQAVASLSAAEEMLVYSTHPIDAKIELSYSKRDNLYYIRSTEGRQCIDFDFSLKVPIQTPALPAAIQIMVDKFNAYGIGELKLETTETRGTDYLNAILKNKKGSCRHRAVAFTHEMKKKFPQVPCRIVVNDCHAFAEVFVKKQWVPCDLGGYPVRLDIREFTLDGLSQITRENLDASGMRVDAKPNPYEKEMETWSPKKDLPLEKLKNYRRQLLQAKEGGKNTLIELGSKAAVDSMALSLQAHCLRIKRPVFYINSPSDILCRADFLKKEGKVGTFVPGPGGSLYEFLTAEYNKDNPPVLIVNYANFTPSEIVSLNALLDKKRRADGVAVPDNALLLGLINTNAFDLYTGSDFYSRFNERHRQPVSNELLESALNQHAVPEKRPENQHCTVINLYHGCDWKAQLLGKWVLTAKGMRFQEGELKKAIARGKTIEIKNGLWQDPEFRFFWQQALMLGHIVHNGELIDTKGMNIVKSEGYPWLELKKVFHLNQDLQETDFILNPSRLGDYFSTFVFQKASKELIQRDGLIAKIAKEGKQTIRVDLTRSLREDDWARLLNECKQYKISLEVNMLPGAKLPKCLQEEDIVDFLNKKPNPKVQIIHSKDPDHTINQLQDPSRIVIDVSECNPSDLLLETKVHYQTKKLKLEFSQHKHALLKALEQGKHIVLTGAISDQLSDALAPMILGKQDIAGKLTIVSKDVDNLRFAPRIRVHKKTPPISNSVVRAKAICPKGWRGLKNLKYNADCLGTFNSERSLDETLAFHAHRNQLLFDVLNKSPYVYMAGLSGCGKSTFIEKELMKGTRHKLYKGENSMERWALDKSDCPKVLFIDEANLSSRKWSELEGLFYNKPPTLLINGELRTLSSQHKIIFAGNPVNYGDERNLAPFFIRHGRTVIFDPLPLSVIYQQILLPVFEATPLSNQAPSLSEPIFEFYAFLCAQSTTDILISPRELQMIALLTLSYCKQKPTVCPIQAAKYYAYALTKSLVPAAKLDLFNQQFGQVPPPIEPLPLPLTAINEQFQVTPSRLPILTHLHEVLLLRELRQDLQANEAQHFGGLGGVLLEGDSSVGKSAMVLALLRAHGFEEVHDLNKPAHQIKPFYRMDVGLPVSEKEKILVKAFYEGAVVIIDEINSSPMMERLLNDLLMGKLPEQYKIPNKKVKPGFMIIGTQNPVSMAGRRPTSTALSRRLWQMEVPNYPAEELMEIILGKERYSQAAMRKFQQIIDAFLLKSTDAKENGYSPSPTLREVFQKADLIKLQYPALKDTLSSSENKSRFANLINPLKNMLFFRSQKQSMPVKTTDNSFINHDHVGIPTLAYSNKA